MTGTLLDSDGQPIIRNFNAKRIQDRSIDELLGLCRGIIADNQVSFEEVKFLSRWITRNESSRNVWPGDVLFSRITEMLAADTFDNKKQHELLQFLKELTGEERLDICVQNLSTTLPFNNPQPDIQFDDSTFCFTGKFLYGTRSSCESAVKDLGGNIVSKPNDYTDFLVIGLVGSRDWIHCSYGRKIEMAVNLRKERSGIAIVSEEHWTQQLELEQNRSYF